MTDYPIVPATKGFPGKQAGSLALQGGSGRDGRWEEAGSAPPQAPLLCRVGMWEGLYCPG